MLAVEKSRFFDYSNSNECSVDYLIERFINQLKTIEKLRCFDRILCATTWWPGISWWEKPIGRSAVYSHWCEGGIVNAHSHQLGITLFSEVSKQKEIFQPQTMINSFTPSTANSSPKAKPNGRQPADLDAILDSLLFSQMMKLLLSPLSEPAEKEATNWIGRD